MGNEGLSDKSSEGAVIQYLHEARTFNEDKYYNALRHKRQWQILAVLAMLFSIACIVLLTYLFPLKEFKPVYLVKDPLSDQYKPLPLLKKPMIITVTDARRAYWINQFLIARESWNPTIVAEREELVYALGSKRVVSHYNAEQAIASPRSFKNRFGYHTMRQIEITGLTHLNENTTALRFNIKHITGSAIKTYHFQGVISYIWDPSLMKNDKDRLLNPFGFLVTRYEKNLELLDQKELSK